MKAARFDRLSQAVGRATSRRRALAVLFGGAATAAAVPYLATRSATAWAGETNLRRRSAFQCVGNFPVLSSCEDINDYVLRCGITCPDGFQRQGADGCTTSNPTHAAVTGTRVVTRLSATGWCASQRVTTSFSMNPRTAVLRPSVTGSCCQGDCDAAVRAYSTGIDQMHEQTHRLRFNEAAARASVEWADKPFRVCGFDTEQAAVGGLQATIVANLQAALESLAEFARTDPEPPLSPRVDCSKCPTGGPNTSCANGRCTCGGDTCPRATARGGCCPADRPHCCNNDCCPPGYSICCTPTDGSICCTPEFPICSHDRSGNPICVRAFLKFSASSRQGVDYIPAAVNGRTR